MYLNVPSDEPFDDVEMEVRVQSTGNDKANARLLLTATIQEEKYTIMGMEMETFTIPVVVIIIIILLISLGLLYIRSKKRKAEEMINKGKMPQVTDYSMSSDGSKVQWEETGQVIPVQYNPPTPMMTEQPFEIQAQRPQTYRDQSYASSEPQPQYYDQPLPFSNVETLAYEYQSMQPLPPPQENFRYKQPQLMPAKQMDEESELQVLEQLDAELAAEAAEVEAGVEPETVTSEVVEPPEFHESDEFSINFKRPELSDAQTKPKNIETKEKVEDTTQLIRPSEENNDLVWKKPNNLNEY